MKPQKLILTLTATATADISTGRFVNFEGTHAAAEDKILGVAFTDSAAGMDTPVVAIGVMNVVTAEAIPAGSGVKSDAEGRAVVATSDAYAQAITDATQGGMVSILIK